MELTTTTYEATTLVRGFHSLTAPIVKTPEDVAQISLKTFRMEFNDDVILLSDVATFLAEFASRYSKEFSSVSLSTFGAYSYLVSMEHLKQMSPADIAFAISARIPFTKLIMD